MFIEQLGGRKYLLTIIFQLSITYFAYVGLISMELFLGTSLGNIATYNIGNVGSKFAQRRKQQV